MNKPSPSPMDEMKPDQIAFEKFLLDKNMSNEKEDDAWGIPGYKHPQISAMFYAWQYLWQTRTPGSDGVGDVVRIRIGDIKQGIARAKHALIQKEYRLIDIWLLTLADQIKSLEHAFEQATPEPVVDDVTLCEGCRCDGKKTEAIHFGDDDDVGFCTPCWGIYTRDCKIEELEAALKAALSQTKKE